MQLPPKKKPNQPTKKITQTKKHNQTSHKAKMKHQWSLCGSEDARRLCSPVPPARWSPASSQSGWRYSQCCCATGWLLWGSPLSPARYKALWNDDTFSKDELPVLSREVSLGWSCTSFSTETQKNGPSSVEQNSHGTLPSPSALEEGLSSKNCRSKGRGQNISSLLQKKAEAWLSLRGQKTKEMRCSAPHEPSDERNHKAWSGQKHLLK